MSRPNEMVSEGSNAPQGGGGEDELSRRVAELSEELEGVRQRLEVAGGNGPMARFGGGASGRRLERARLKEPDTYSGSQPDEDPSE